MFFKLFFGTLSSCLLADTLPLSDSYTAPAAPKTLYSAPQSYNPPQSYNAPQSYDAPSYSAPQSYSSPGVQTVAVELPAADYYKHETHHYYHAGPPRVYKVHVPVTQKPYTVHVPQNVPVNFVPVNVPARHDLGPISVVELDPFSSYDFDDPYVKRKELVKGALLLGTGVLKGALLTTLYNNLANNKRNLRENYEN